MPRKGPDIPESIARGRQPAPGRDTPSAPVQSLDALENLQIPVTGQAQRKEETASAQSDVPIDIESSYPDADVEYETHVRNKNLELLKYLRFYFPQPEESIQIARPIEPIQNGPSNPSDTTDTIVIHGLDVDDDNRHEIVKHVMAVGGKTLTVIPNDRSSNKLIEYTRGFLGALDQRLGMLVEKEAVSNLMYKLVENYTEGRNTRILAHSQGAIIASNALYLLKSPLPRKDWEALNKTVDVIAIAPGVNWFPSDVSVRAIGHANDRVPKTVDTLVKLVKPFLAALDINQAGKRVPILYVDQENGSHAWQTYAQNVPEFIKARCRNGEQLARAVFEVIDKGAFCDWVPNKIISDMIKERNGIFAARILAYDRSGDLGRYSIEAFKPDLEEIAGVY